MVEVQSDREKKYKKTFPSPGFRMFVFKKGHKSLVELAAEENTEVKWHIPSCELNRVTAAEESQFPLSRCPVINPWLNLLLGHPSKVHLTN